MALGINESAGYGGVALAAGLSGWLAASFAARDVLVVGGAMVAAVGFLLSALFMRDTAAHVAPEQADHHQGADRTPPKLRDAFARATYREPALRSCSQAGLVNNLNDGIAWGLGAIVPGRPRSRRGRHRPWSRPSIRPSGAWRKSAPAPGLTRWGESR